jgi:adenylate cyclase
VEHEASAPSGFRTLDPTTVAKATIAFATNSDADEAERRLGYLMRAGTKLAGAQDVGAVFEAICEGQEAEMPGIERFVLLFPEKTNAHRVFVRGGESPLAVLPDWVSRTVCQHVFESGKVVRSIDVLRDRRFQDAKSLHFSGARTVAAVPILAGDEVVGVLYADAKNQILAVDEISESGLAFLVSLASLAGQALKRTLLQESLSKEERNRARLARYHSPSILPTLLSQASVAAGRVPPAEFIVTAMFADIAGFTALSQRLEPPELSRTLDRILEELVDALFASGGTLDKYIGDCVMGIFGAPLATPDFADRAIECAREMRRRFNSLSSAGQIPPELGLRIAMATGPALVGDIGSQHRVEFTAIGQVVNRAARIEGFIQAGTIACDASTVERLTRTHSLNSAGEHVLSGLRDKVLIYSVD